jgi:hypothetical protein
VSTNYAGTGITRADIDEALNSVGQKRLSEAAHLILEPSGRISVIE